MQTIASGGEALWQKVLLTEWGGMNDVLLQLYSLTGDASHLSTARRFNGWVFTAPLAAGEDDLANLPFAHANFHLPEIIGNARAFELTGNETDRAIVNTFLDALVANHSYVTGGSSSGECWQAPRDLGAFLTTQTEESCTQYNVLKISRHRFQWSADAADADFYERAIWNGIVGNQKRSSAGGPTSYIYMLPLGGANKKPWGKSDHGFPCCWGTLSESFAKLGDSVFFQSPAGDTLYVNQFVSASAAWNGVMVEQTADFPLHPTKTATLRIRVPKGGNAHFALMVRVPGWVMGSAAAASLNDASVLLGEAAKAGSGSGFARFERTWADGDALSFSFPPSLRAEPLNDYHAEYNATFAFMFGPLVLAAVDVDSDVFVPRGGDAFRTDPSVFISRNSTTKLEFEAVGEDGTKLRMIPLREVMDERYVVYFMTAGTKPAQPAVHYCPRSRPRQDAFEVQSPEVEEAALVSRWSAPSLPPREGLAPAGAADTERHIVSSRGVHWKLQGDRVVAKAPAPRGAMPAEAPHALALAERASAISSSLD